MSKIELVTEDSIEFYNGDIITYDHDQDCCEHNYADFYQLDDLAFKYDFKTPLEFKYYEEAGFIFGDKYRKFFVPCYSIQNGYYTHNIRIYYNGEKVLDFDASYISDDYGDF